MVAWMINLGDLLAHVRLRGEAVRLGHELREPDELVRLLGEGGEPAEPLPEPERVREHRCVSGLAVEEDALVRHEDVVEDHEALGQVVAARHREAPRVGVARRVGRVHHLTPGAFTGTIAATAQASSPGFIDLGGSSSARARRRRR
jgi:hypothetical protein